MIEKSLHWSTRNATSGAGKNGWRGEVLLFTVSWDSFSPQDDADKWKLRCKLPGVREVIGNFKTPEEATVRAEYVFSRWLTLAKLTV